MSCWVVPTIAAEYWRTSVQHVLDCIERNAVPVLRENGFTFVDILPDPKPIDHRVPADQRPPTYTEPVAAVAEVEPEIEPEMQVVDEPESADWVSRNPQRRQTSQLRRRPGTFTPAESELALT
jgi:hypothetical protein